MRTGRIGAVMLMVAILSTASSAAGQPAGDDLGERWHLVISRLEPAAFVSLRLKDGHRVKGTVLAANDRSFTFMPRTRIPVAARDVRYEEVATLERAREGMSPGAKVLIGAGAGVGGFLLLILTLVAAYD